MTREEVINGLYDIKNWKCNGDAEMYKTIVEAIQALKQPEPCDDAVSRKAVEEMLQNGFPARGMWEIEGDVVKQTVCETLADALMELEKLPSVTPKLSNIDFLMSGSELVFYDNDHGFCINTQDVLEHIRGYMQ